MIIAAVKIFAGLPLAAFKERIAASLSSQIRTCLDSRLVDTLKHIIGKGKVLVTFPFDTPLGKGMVIAAHTETDTPILLVRDLRERQRIKVEVNDIVKSPHSRAHDIAKLIIVFKIDMTEGEACQIADHEVARLYSSHDDCLTVDLLDLCLCL